MITFSMTKGGVSKSTLCTNVAVGLARRGEKVKVFDFDHRNRGSFSFFQKRERADVECELIESKKDLGKVLEFDGVVLCDTGAFDDNITRAVISASDTLVVPFNPKSDKDSEGFLLFLDTLQEIDSIRGNEIPTLLVASMIHPLRSHNQVIGDIEPILGGHISLGGIVTRRASYEHSGFKGNSVFETRDDKAQLEIKNLVDEILRDK